MKPPSSVQMVVHSRVMGLTQRMNDYPMSGKSVGLEEDLHRMNVVGVMVSFCWKMKVLLKRK